MAISDADLAYWLGVLFAARKRGDARMLGEALKALRERGVTIAFHEGERVRGNHAAAPRSAPKNDG